jgi:hypothetical protein
MAWYNIIDEESNNVFHAMPKAFYILLLLLQFHAFRCILESSKSFIMMVLGGFMRIFYRKTVLFLILGLFSAPLFAQTAAKLEALLNEPALTWSAAAAFVLEASEAAGSLGQQEAFSFAVERKWLPKNAAPADTARLNGVALLLLRSFNLKGGIFYSISKSPHHAYRELVYKGLIRGDTDPDMPVSGRDLLLMVSRLLSVKEKEDAKSSGAAQL